MRLADVLGALRRQWVLTLVLVLLTAGLGFGAARIVPQRYIATAHVLFLPPAISVAVDENPYMKLGGLYQAVEMVGVALSDQDTTEELKALSAKADVVVRQDPQSSAPLLLVSVVDSDEARTLRILDVVLAKVPTRLDQLQADINVRAANRVTSIVLTKDTAAKPTGLDQLRAIIVAVAAGLLFTTVFIGFVDGAVSRRRARRSGQDTSNKGLRTLPSVGPAASRALDDPGGLTGVVAPRRARAPSRKIRIRGGGQRIRPSRRH